MTAATTNEWIQALTNPFSDEEVDQRFLAVNCLVAANLEDKVVEIVVNSEIDASARACGHSPIGDLAEMR